MVLQQQGEEVETEKHLCSLWSDGVKGVFLSLPELQERCLTEGYNCHPICVTCLQGGKKVLRVKNATPNQMQKRKERLAKGK